MNKITLKHSNKQITVDAEDYEKVANLKPFLTVRRPNRVHFDNGKTHLVLDRFLKPYHRSCTIKYANGDFLDLRKDNLIITRLPYDGNIETRSRKNRVADLIL